MTDLESYRVRIVRMSAQWMGVLKNLGQWKGSFGQFSPQGVLLEDIPSQLTLSLSENEQTVSFHLKRFSDITPIQDIVLQFQYPGPGSRIPFFEQGAFSQGALQWSRYSQSGAELSLIHDDRRLRLVQLFESGQSLSRLTLIRETLEGSNSLESPPLTLTDLIGTWRGEAISLYPDGRVTAPMQTTLAVKQEGDRLQQSLSYGQQTLVSTGRIEDRVHPDGQFQRVSFAEGQQPMQLLLMPGGGSALCPIEVQAQKPFVLEMGWLITPNLRQRLVRSYDASGEWVSLTLVTEHKQL
jgi:hypothetical protein